MVSTAFERKRSTSLYWYNRASDFMGAAATLRFAASQKEMTGKIVVDAGLGAGFDLSIATHRIFYMLCGMALELGYKAILVEEKKVLPMSHNLSSLAKAAGFSHSDKDEALLKIWSQLIIWDGKYPVPKEGVQMDTYHELIEATLWEHVDGTPFKRMNDRIDWTSFKAFWDCLSERYFVACDQK